MKIVSFVGFADAGKGTASSVLIDQGYFPMAFADGIKDCLSAIFGWDRKLLEGDTTESRIFRETVDPWWANKLNIAEFSPRFAMQNFGTETMRNHFHDNIWVMNAENRLSKLNKDKIVFIDVRHPNEIKLTREKNGKLIRIKKGPEPIWFDIARKANEGDVEAQYQIKNVYKIHNSEMAWIGHEFDLTIENDGTKEDLIEKVKSLNIVL